MSSEYSIIASSQTLPAVESSVAVSSTIPVNFSDIYDVIDSGKPYYCVYNNPRTRLELWVQGHSYHGVISQHKPPLTHYVSDGVWCYIWVENTNSGIKYLLSESKGLTGEVEAGSISAGGDYTVNYDVAETSRQATSVECSLTAIPEGKFTAPPRIQFSVVGSHIVEDTL